MLLSGLIFIFVLFLAYANGANDNIKGVVTLYGSKTATYKKALIWTSITTVAGSLLALFLAGGLIAAFKGKGIIPEEVIQLNEFPVAVGLAAALTVMLATRFGLPVSTTHALIGALAGAGWVASRDGINHNLIAQKFFLPLIAGPVISLLLTIMVYPILNKFRKKLKINHQTCLCVGNKIYAREDICANGAVSVNQMLATHSLNLPSVDMADEAYCRVNYSGKFLGIKISSIVDVLHYISGGLVCFSRGLNDTPKIAALLLIGSRFSSDISVSMVALAMLIGGLIHSKKIAVTMGEKVTDMSTGQALTANLITGFMVLVASRFGVPVSTTHVSCGPIFGLGILSGKANYKIISQILLAWVTTLPIGAVLGMCAMKIIY